MPFPCTPRRRSGRPDEPRQRHERLLGSMWGGVVGPGLEMEDWENHRRRFAMIQVRLALFSAVFAALTIGCGDDGGATEPDAGPPAVDQCLSATDRMLVEPDAGMADAGPGYTVSSELLDCALGPCLSEALGEGDATACLNTCLDGTVYAPLSSGCRGCYIETFYCGRDNCVNFCLGGNEESCRTCSDMHCTPRWEICTGLD